MVKHGILLLGPSQAGKSSLANLLVNGACDHKTNVFKVGNGTESCTITPQGVSFEYVYERLEDQWEKESTGQTKTGIIRDIVPMKDGPVNLVTRSLDISVIDSAGAGDHESKDSSTMLELYKYLLQPNIEISCVVLVIKYPTLQDDKYKRIIGFYKEMLSSIFTKNAVVILTNVELQNPKWVKRENRSGHDPEKTIKKVMKDLTQMLELNYDIPYYALNLLADADDKEDYQHTLSCRRKILERCADIPGFHPSRLKFPKPLDWKKEDDDKLNDLRTRRTNLQQDLKEENMKFYEERTGELKRDISCLQRSIDDFNTDELVCVHSETLHGERNLFWWRTADFNIQTKHPIERVIVSGGNLSGKNQSTSRVSGSVKSDWFCPLDATVTVMSFSREVYAERIAECKESLSKKKDALDKEEERFKSSMAGSDAHRKLHKQLLVIQSQIDELEKESLTYEQILPRLKDWVSGHYNQNK